MMNNNKNLQENKALADEELENVSGGVLLIAEERKPFLDLSDEACEAIPNDATRKSKGGP